MGYTWSITPIALLRPREKQVDPYINTLDLFK
jgi:hypothetical protein